MDSDFWKGINLHSLPEIMEATPSRLVGHLGKKNLALLLGAIVLIGMKYEL